MSTLRPVARSMQSLSFALHRRVFRIRKPGSSREMEAPCHGEDHGETVDSMVGLAEVPEDSVFCGRLTLDFKHLDRNVSRNLKTLEERGKREEAPELLSDGRA